MSAKAALDSLKSSTLSKHYSISNRKTGQEPVFLFYVPSLIKDIHLPQQLQNILNLLLDLFHK